MIDPALKSYGVLDVLARRGAHEALLAAEQLKRNVRPVFVACFECRIPVESPGLPRVPCQHNLQHVRWLGMDTGSEPSRSALVIYDGQGNVTTGPL